MLPLWLCSISGSTARIVRTVPIRLTSSMRIQSASVIFWNSFWSAMPALQTTASIVPNRAFPSATASFHCRGILLIGQKRQCAGLPSEPVRRFPAFAVSKRGIPSVFGKCAHTGGTDAARASGDENSLRHVRWQPSAVLRTDTGSDPCSVPDLPQCRYR